MVMGRKQLQKTGQKNNNKIDKLDRRCFVFALIAKTELTARDNMRLVSFKGLWREFTQETQPRST